MYRAFYGFQSGSLFLIKDDVIAIKTHNLCRKLDGIGETIIKLERPIFAQKFVIEDISNIDLEYISNNPEVLPYIKEALEKLITLS